MWNTLKRSWVNFSHFSEEFSHKEAYDSLTSDGLFSAFLRGRAIQCIKGQKGIDLVIPMIIPPVETGLYSRVDSSHISAIIIQVKNTRAESFAFTTENIEKGHYFHIRHIRGLAEGGLPYVGIWMSFGATPVDFAVEGLAKPLVMKRKLFHFEVY
jgi:hypothetical protein